MNQLCKYIEKNDNYENHICCNRNYYNIIVYVNGRDQTKFQIVIFQKF